MREITYGPDPSSFRQPPMVRDSAEHAVASELPHVQGNLTLISTYALTGASIAPAEFTASMSAVQQPASVLRCASQHSRRARSNCTYRTFFDSLRSASGVSAHTNLLLGSSLLGICARHLIARPRIGTPYRQAPCMRPRRHLRVGRQAVAVVGNRELPDLEPAAGGVGGRNLLLCDDDARGGCPCCVQLPAWRHGTVAALFDGSDSESTVVISARSGCSPVCPACDAVGHVTGQDDAQK